MNAYIYKYIYLINIIKLHRINILKININIYKYQNNIYI